LCEAREGDEKIQLRCRIKIFSNWIWFLVVVRTQSNAYQCLRGNNWTETMRKRASPKQKPEDFSEVVFIRCPPSLRAAIADAARQQLTSAANYTRSAVVAKLRAEGLYPVRDNETATSASSAG
jgi:hypothetical protein